jgi:hypothetical protein
MAGKGHQCFINTVGAKNGNLKAPGLNTQLIERPGGILFIQQDRNCTNAKEIGTGSINIEAQMGQLFKATIEVVGDRGSHTIGEREEQGSPEASPAVAQK